MKKFLYSFIILCFSISLFSYSIDDFNNLCKKTDLKNAEKYIDETEINSLGKDGSTPLIISINKRSYDMVKLLISKGADVNLQDSFNSAPLMEALRYFDYDIIKILIENGADVNVSNIYGNTPLFRAVENFIDLSNLNDTILKSDENKNKTYKPSKKEEQEYKNKINIINMLLDNGASMNQCNKEGISPVMKVLHDNNLVVFDIFVNKGFDINSYIGLKKTTPLNLSILENNELFFNYLINKGADLTKKDNDGMTPANISVISNNLNFFKYLTDHGIDINSPINNDLDSPLSSACKLGRTDFVKYLTENGADLNYRDKYGYTPLHNGILYENIIKILTDKGANPNLRNSNYDTPLHIAYNTNKIKSAEYLINAGAYLLENIYSETPLQIAEKDNNTEFISLLKKAIPLVLPEYFQKIKDGNTEFVRNHLSEYKDFTDNDGNSGLDYAIIYRQNEIFSLLTDQCDINKKNIGKITPLMFASSANDLNMCKKLIEKGADVNSANVKGISPIISSVINKNYGMTELFAKAGADLNVKDINSVSLLCYAYKYANTDIISYLTNRSDINYLDNDGNSPVYYLLKDNDKNLIIENLNNYLKIKDDRNFYNLNHQSPLHIACLNNLDKDIIDLLITEENINTKDYFGYTPIVYGTINGNYDTVNLLINRNAQIFSTKELNLLHLCLYNYNKDLFNLLLNKEKDINSVSKQGTPLNIALENNNYEAAKILIEKGADINLYGNDYPLAQCLLYKKDEITDLMIEKGVKTDILWQGDISPLMIAAKYCDYNRFIKFLDSETDINRKSKLGYTALHLSLYNNTKDRLKIIKAIIEKGADVNIQSETGTTPLYNSCGMGLTEETKLLLEHGADTKKPNQLQLVPADIAKDRGYNDILSLFNEKHDEKIKEFDNCNYKLRLINVPNKYYPYIRDILEENLQNTLIKNMKYENNTIDTELSTSYVIGEINKLYSNIENKLIRFEKTYINDKSVDICCTLIIK